MEPLKLTDNDFKTGFTKRDVDEFTATRQHYLEHKTYTREPLKSRAWWEFWKEERRRCREGYNIGRDYITGYHYFYLNYSPILKVNITDKKEDDDFSQSVGERVKGFPNFWDGDYNFYHYIDEAEKLGEHAMVLGARGIGKSLKTGSMLVRNYEHYRDSKNYAFAYSEEFLIKDGLLTKAWFVMDHISNTTPWAKSRDEKDKDLHRKASKKIQQGGVWTVDPRSYNSEIIGVVVGDRIDKARGKRGKLLIYEEIGMFKKSNRAWNANRPAVEQGGTTFGLMLGIGTGGTEGSNFEGAEDMFRKPEAYKIHGIKNRWEEGKENSKIAYFWPAYINYDTCYNTETGNSNFEKAFKKIEEDRLKVADASDPTTLTRRKAEIPVTPSEVLMRISHSIFPRQELTSQEVDIENNDHRYKDADFVGEFELDKDTQKYKFINKNIKPIYEFPHTSNKNMKGAIVLFEHPKTTPDGDVIYNRYFAGIDSYDHDESTTKSLGSIFIGDSWTRRIVAEYTGRPDTAEEFYENVRRLLLYYNARANYENHNKGLATYLKQKNCEYLLADEPSVVREVLSDVTMRKTTGRRKTGTTPSVPVQQYGRKLLATWLKESTKNPDKEEEIQCHKFRALAAIKEMLHWNDEGNFDRVDALTMLMLIWEDAKVHADKAKENIKGLAMDPYFMKFFNKQTKPKNEWQPIPKLN